MQLLKTISDQLFNRTPQPPTEPSQPAHHPLPSSDAAAAPPVRNAVVSVPPGSDFAPFDGFPSPAAPHSNANRLSSSRKPPSVRRLFRRPTAHSGLGMPMLSPGKNQMRKADDSTRADELRLFGDNGRPDPNAVPIIPGQMCSNRKPHIPSGFKPVDKISKGSRQSGPVRANGKESQKLFRSQRRSALSPPRSNQIADTPERSSKRRRVESPEELPKRISISDDDAMDSSTIRSSPVAIRPTALSPTPSQLSSQAKWSGHASEYRDVDKTTRVPRPSPRKEPRFIDRFSSEDKDLSFTRDAADERRRRSSASVADPCQTSPMHPGEKPEIFVEITSQPSANDDLRMKSPPRVRIPPLAKGRLSISRESPDELQGEATVQPVPTSLDRSTRDKTSVDDRSSPSDIRPTTFASHEKRARKSRKGKPNNKRPAPETFRLGFFRTGPHIRDALGGENDMLILDPVDDKITITVPDKGNIREISLGKVNRILVGDEDSRKIRLELSMGPSRDHKVDIELSTSNEKARFKFLIQKLNQSRTIQIDLLEKPEKWLDKAFNKSKRENQPSGPPEDSYKRLLDVFDATEELPKRSLEPCKRPKLSDALQDSDGKTTAELSVRSGGDLAEGAISSIPAIKDSQVLKPETPKGVEIPVKKYNTTPQASVRATRSMARREPSTVVCDDDDGDEDLTSQLNLGVDQKWNKKPLVYPRFGKKKAEVNALDLERLAPHQFLNDNIIGLYIRFLEDHLQRCNAEVARRVYFFNSYFFATLTNSPKGKRTINYEGVEKWTRNVDLFSYDYIVVPINEDAHWYVVIICNLPHLEGILDLGTSRPPSEVREVPETPEPTKPDEEQGTSLPQSPQEESTRHSLASMILSEKQGPQADGSRSGEEEWPEREEYPGPSRARFSASSGQPQADPQVGSEIAATPKKGRKPKKKVPLGQKYDVTQPIVITFDSLGVPRNTTINTLREYLYAEARSKRDTEINKTLIKGMKAREVPQQPNYSDCGLYLLAYIEKFIQDPDLFVKNLLRKEMRLEDWPQLRSNLLRSRLRNFMEQLYAEQGQLTKDKADDIGLMVDQRPMSYLLGPSSIDDAENDEAKKSAQDKHSKLSRPKSQESSRRESSVQSHRPQPDAAEGMHPGKFETQESIIHIEPPDDSPIQSPKPKTTNNYRQNEIIEVPDSQDKANAPLVEAAQSAEAGSLPPVTKSPTRENSVYIDDSEGVEATPPERKIKTQGGGFEIQIQVKQTPPGSPNIKR
ncbi:hypothetical protein BJY01DRAFT_213707 [Aspergillus pseudoustus]|uniref:Ubiquitin-like protease family profile domain-containing protein n=1 Tax=Aspergillus pseudoustus TaxID=1810923 RepID=A0ABR4K1C2_9EURO